MKLRITPQSVLVFDLDDTLYKEVDFLKSAFLEISNYLETTSGETFFHQMITWYESGQDVFRKLENACGKSIASKELLIQLYRNHIPQIKLAPTVKRFIDIISVSSNRVGIITDGRSITQRNKIVALGLNLSDSNVIISEEFGFQKPSAANYLYFEEKYPLSDYFYFGDNIEKDFITPNSRGWGTICLLDDGRNIHPQDWSVDRKYHPKFKIKTFSEIEVINET